MMDKVVPSLIFLAVCLFVNGETSLQWRPQNAKFHALNLNLSISWDPPSVQLLPNETIMYTVVHDTPRQGRNEVPHCINITRTTCHLWPLFPEPKSFHFAEYFFIEAMSSMRLNCTGKMPTQRFYHYDVTVSGPVINHTTITDKQITAVIHGPETPYVRRGKVQYMINKWIERCGLLLQNINYNSSLFRHTSGSAPSHTYEKPEETFNRDAFGRVEYKDLDPYTNYTLYIQSSMGSGRYSQDITAFQFQTLQRVVVCPENWLTFEESCYQFHDQPMPWNEASDYCMNNSPHNYGHLVTIYDSNENEFIINIALGGIKTRTWIGLSDQQEEGTFSWLAHNDEQFFYSNWKNGEPNNRNGNENCVEINRGRLGLWNDIKCRKPLPFLCEMEL